MLEVRRMFVWRRHRVEYLAGGKVAISTHVFVFVLLFETPTPYYWLITLLPVIRLFVQRVVASGLCL